MYVYIFFSESYVRLYYIMQIQIIECKELKTTRDNDSTRNSFGITAPDGAAPSNPSSGAFQSRGNPTPCPIVSCRHSRVFSRSSSGGVPIVAGAPVGTPALLAGRRAIPVGNIRVPMQRNLAEASWRANWFTRPARAGPIKIRRLEFIIHVQHAAVPRVSRAYRKFRRINSPTRRLSPIHRSFPPNYDTEG